MSAEYKYATFTNVGSRSINEDSIGVFKNENGNCFILCDGLGGHGMGDVASKLVVDTFEEIYKNNKNPEAFFDEAFTISQKRLLDKQKELKAARKMKTTAVSIVTNKNEIYVGHIGDSRGYIFKHNKVKMRTLDHSVPQMLVLSKEIKESEIRNHPDRNIVLKVLGVASEKKEFDLMKPIKARQCQALLLCSDGFWELIEEDDMCKLLSKAKSVEEWLKDMVDVVAKNGKGKDMDNFSAIAVWKL